MWLEFLQAEEGLEPRRYHFMALSQENKGADRPVL